MGLFVLWNGSGWSVDVAFQAAPGLGGIGEVPDPLAFDDEGAGHGHGVVVRMAAHEPEDGGFRVIPDFLESLAGLGVQAAEWFIEEEDVSGAGADGELGHDEACFPAVSGGEAAIGFRGVQLDPLGKGHRILEACGREERAEDGFRREFGIESQVFREVLGVANGAEVPADGFERSRQRAEERGFSPTVPGQKEMGAVFQAYRRIKAGERAAVANSQAFGQMNAGGL